MFAANKLAYFLQRMGQPMKLQFKPHHYGPYAIGVEKVLYALNGVYLRGIEQGQVGPFEPLYLNYGKCTEIKQYVEKELPASDRERLAKLMELLRGFASDLPLEILATVDYLMQETPGMSLDGVTSAIARWSSRKEKLFKDEYIAIAYQHLQTNSHLFV